jgi:uncharacterized metal-binding protein YceD (DUF177 family)
MPDQPQLPEFSRPVAADRVGRDGLDLAIEASAEERAALTRRFGLVSLDALSAQCRLRPVAGGMIELTASFDAQVVQECVVSLEPVPAAVHGTFKQRYALEPTVLRSFAAAEGEEFDPDADDPPEALQKGAIDLGEAVAQHLAVTLDPYPRAPGIDFVAVSDAEEGVTQKPHEQGVASRPSPFSALAKLKK